ncbi:hypothetical protein GF324_00945 [bacterium]|nr:hypothetical protein [bacterium]
MLFCPAGRIFSKRSAIARGTRSMSEAIHEVIIPRIGVNDETARLVAWEVKDGDEISVGMCLCVLETTKAAVDLDAELEGVILTLAEEGDEVRVGETVALIGPDFTQLAKEKEQRSAAQQARRETKDVRATKKATALADELGVDLSTIDSDGIIREEDVRRAAGKKGLRTSAPEPVMPGEPGVLDEEFLHRIEADPSFAALDSDTKIFLYRKFGAVIGEDVTIGRGTAPLCRVLKLGDGSGLGDGSVVRADRFELGIGSIIGARAKILEAIRNCTGDQVHV